MTTKANNATKSIPFSEIWDGYVARLRDFIDSLADDVRKDLVRERIGQQLLFRAGGSFKKYMNKKGDDNLGRAILYRASADMMYGDSNYVSKTEVEDPTVKGGKRPQTREDRIQYGIDSVVDLMTDVASPSQLGAEEADEALAALDAELGIDMTEIEEAAKLQAQREMDYNNWLRPQLREFLEGAYFEAPDVAPNEFDADEARISYVKCLEAVERKLTTDVATCRKFFIGAKQQNDDERQEYWRNNAFLAAQDLKMFQQERQRHASE